MRGEGGGVKRPTGRSLGEIAVHDRTGKPCSADKGCVFDHFRAGNEHYALAKGLAGLGLRASKTCERKSIAYIDVALEAQTKGLEARRKLDGLRRN